MCIKKSVEPRVFKKVIYILAKTSHLESLEDVYYWEKRKDGQITDLEFHRLEIVKKTCVSNTVETFGYVEQPKALAILSDVTVRKCAVEQEDLKPYW